MAGDDKAGGGGVDFLHPVEAELLRGDPARRYVLLLRGLAAGLYFDFLAAGPTRADEFASQCDMLGADYLVCERAGDSFAFATAPWVPSSRAAARPTPDVAGVMLTGARAGVRRYRVSERWGLLLARQAGEGAKP